MSSGLLKSSSSQSHTFTWIAQCTRAPNSNQIHPKIQLSNQRNLSHETVFAIVHTIIALFCYCFWQFYRHKLPWSICGHFAKDGIAIYCRYLLQTCYCSYVSARTHIFSHCHPPSKNVYDRLCVCLIKYSLENKFKKTVHWLQIKVQYIQTIFYLSK